MTNEFITADINCKNGFAMLTGEIVEVREKAVKIIFEITPVFSRGCMKPIYDRTAWIPKSQIKQMFLDGTDIPRGYEISRWFANNCMKSYRLKTA